VQTCTVSRFAAEVAADLEVAANAGSVVVDRASAAIAQIPIERHAGLRGDTGMYGRQATLW
jgi:hypothetical protein